MFYELTRYGFKYGPIEIEKLFSNEEKGWVVIGAKTQKADIQIYATKTGKVRIFVGNKEIKL